MKTILHYTNGTSYTFKNTFVSSVTWDSKGQVIIDGEVIEPAPYSSWLDRGFRITLADIKYIECVDKECGCHYIHFNPNIKSSIKLDFKTAGERTKENRVKQ